MLRLLDTPPKELFWSGPLAEDSDFTLEDPLALDYLAQQVGLWLFRDLTTRTNRAQYYAVVLYGLRLAEYAVRDRNYHSDDDTRTRLFERWERFWALATVEYREGKIDRGDVDAMRGIRGAKREWLRRNGNWNPDFELISRQNELGGLGAYLSSLRKYGLVHDGTLKVAKPAEEILNAFWGETELRDTQGRYEEWALDALSSKAIEHSHGKIRLSVIGKRSRLSSIHSQEKQQQRIWKALFLDASDGTTLPLAKGLIAADREDIYEPERLLEGLKANRWETLSADVYHKVEIALAFGHVMRVLLSRFNRAYDYVDRHGSIVGFGTVSQVAFPESEMPQLRYVASKLLDAKNASRFNKLPFYGREFLTLLKQLSGAESIECLRHLLIFQRTVQRSRRGGGEWLREENGKLAMRVPGYNGAQNPGAFPNLKLDVVRSLLRDLGRIG
jgi:hypothetical protein